MSDYNRQSENHVIQMMNRGKWVILARLDWTLSSLNHHPHHQIRTGPCLLAKTNGLRVSRDEGILPGYTQEEKMVLHGRIKPSSSYIVKFLLHMYAIRSYGWWNKTAQKWSMLFWSSPITTSPWSPTPKPIRHQDEWSPLKNKTKITNTTSIPFSPGG